MGDDVKPRVSRDPAVVRARILDAAEAEFMAVGYAVASTNRMLERFGGSKPTMFRHFPTKRALFDAVVARIATRWTDAIAWRDIAEDTPRPWLTAFARMALAWITASDNLFVGRMAVAEGAAFPEVAATYRSLAVEPIEALLAERLRGWTEAGLLARADPARAATAFLDLTLSGIVSRALYRVPADPATLDAHVAFAVDLFLDGMRPRG